MLPLIFSMEKTAYPSFSPMTGFKKILLNNGLTVFVKEEHKLPIVTVQLWVRAGSLDENEKNNGVSHFLEHMLFKGTKKYAVGEISRIVESYGGITNAGTSKEFTEYYIDIPTPGFNDALDIILDIAQNASFPADELERERMVILEEVKRSEDDPEHLLFENFNKQLFFKTNYKFRIIGTTQTVSNLSRQDIINYYQKLYVPENMTLVIAGDIDFKEIQKLVEEKCSAMRQGIPNERAYLIEPITQATTLTTNKNVQQSYILCGFLGPDLGSDRQFTGDVLSTILGSGISSRLYQKLREEKQLVYTIGSGFYSQQGSSIFYISTICEPDKVDIVMKEIAAEFDNIMSNGVSDAELERAKEIIRSHWFFDQETISQKANVIGYWSTLNRLDMIKKYLTKISAVDNDKIKEFIKIHYTGLTTSVINPEITNKK